MSANMSVSNVMTRSRTAALRLEEATAALRIEETAAGGHYHPAAQRGVFRHRPPFPGSQ
jgi:hypothetical protein